jgi:membrane-associated phospholipid phosphatase
MRSAIDSLGRRLPHGWRDFWIQAAVFWTFNVGYELSHGLADGARDVAIANGQRVLETERALGIAWEHAVQHWTLETAPGFFLWLANNTYFNCQFTISFGFLFWIYLFRNHAFYFVRNTILFIDFIGLVGYLVIPTAPPRMFPGFVDTLNSQPVNFKSGIIATFANPYAAMPSLHSAYAITLGITGILVCRSLVAKLIWTIYPSVVVYAIVATGNHFFLDAIAGACVAGLATLLSLAVARGVTPRVDRAPVGFLVPRGAPSAAPA